MASSRTVMWRRRSRRHDEDGAAAVEFALVLVPFLIVVFGLIQYGFYFFAAQAGSSAANSALRQLAVGNCQSQTALENYINSRIQGSAAGNATVTTSYYDTTGALVTNAPVAQNVPVGGTVKLTITFSPINLKLPLVPFINNAQVKREVQARVEDVVDEGCGV